MKMIIDIGMACQGNNQIIFYYGNEGYKCPKMPGT